MEICFVVNPKAGRGKGKAVSNEIQRYMEGFSTSYVIRYTSKPGEAELIARRAAEEGFKKIAAVGGDGTIYEVINGLIGTEAVLGIVPAGTGNDLAKSLGISENPEEAIGIILGDKETNLDCGRANKRFFINVAGVGFDVEILREVERIKKIIPGKWAYIIGTIKTLFYYKFKKVSIKIDDRSFDQEILLIAMANGKYFGGGMMIAPEANLTDGLLEICIVNKLPKYKILRLFPTIFTGKHIHEEEVSMYRGKKITISGNSPLSVNLDGDIVGTIPLTIEVVPKALRVLIP